MKQIERNTFERSVCEKKVRTNRIKQIEIINKKQTEINKYKHTDIHTYSKETNIKWIENERNDQ